MAPNTAAVHAPGAPPSLRVLVVDDDAVFRRILSRTVEGLAGVTLVGTAASLATARAKIAAGGIDVVTIDVVLDGESGVELVKWIRKEHPTVVAVLVTAGLDRSVRTNVDALVLGAAALIAKPAGPQAQQELKASFARVFGEMRKPVPTAITSNVVDSTLPAPRDLIAVGASTGGPPVVLALLNGLPKDWTVPIVIVQHMPAAHVPYFAALLCEQSGRKVAVAQDGQRLEPKSILLAGDGRHLVVEARAKDLIVRHDNGPEEHNCRPAVDPLFRSVAAAVGSRCVGVVISGMGSDGALGAVALRKRGAPVVAQDAASSVVWGMPGAVVARGAACAIAPAAELASWVRRWTPAGRTS